MHKIEIQGSGFPATNKTWRFLRDMINQVSSLTALGGDNYILSGCENDGNDVITDGFIVYNGELLPFIGGPLGTEVSIVESIEQTVYLEDLNNDGQGDAKDTYFERVAQFGNSGAVTFNWADLKPITGLKLQSTPIGGIIMWSGAVDAIPAGWLLCDGTNGTPNLSGRFIVGFSGTDPDYDGIGKTGGAKGVTLSEEQIPPHNHDGTANFPAHTHNYKDRYLAEINSSQVAPLNGGIENHGANIAGSGDTDNDNRYLYYKNAVTESADAQSANLTTNNKGGGQAHENRPPYFTLAYIIYMGV